MLTMRINELDTVCSPDKQDRIHQFCDWCCGKLGINTPKLTLKPHNDTSALGYTDMADGSVTVVVGDRHQMDIMRTLAHELVHCKQMESYEPDGATGSDDENEANAMAGVLMREWGQNNPDLYTEDYQMDEGKQKMSAQDRLEKRAAKHGIGTPDKEKFYADMKKKFQQSLDRKDESGLQRYTGIKKYGKKGFEELQKAGRDGASEEEKGKIKDKHLGKKKADEGQKCWKGYEKKGTKKMFGKTVNNCVKKESVEAELEESKTARMMALITALGAAYGLEDDAREFAYKIQQNIDNAQNAEPNPGRPDPVTKGNPLPGADRVMRPPVDEIAPAIAAVGAVGRGVASAAGAAARGVAKGVGSMAKTAGTKMAINKMQGEIEDDEANEASTTSKILKGAPGAPSGKPKSMREKAVSKSQQRFFGMVDALKKGDDVKGATPDMRKAAKDMSKKDVKDFAKTKHKGLPNRVSEAVNVQSIKDEVTGAVRSGNPREMKRVDDTIAKRISDLMDLRGTAGKEVDAQIMDALPVLKKAQMYLRDKTKMSEEAKKDACYNKVRSRYKVWPSAYASGALVQCRKKGAKNWGNKSKK